jgi:hypothetical protein
MSNRKGELSSAQIDREWPHQVALRADFICGAKHAIIEQIKAELGGCPRGHTVRHNDTGYVVYCFSDLLKADTFRELFRGEPFNPKDRGRGDSWWEWRKPAKALTPEAAKRELREHLDAARLSAKAYGFREVAEAIELAIDPLRGVSSS